MRKCCEAPTNRKSQLIPQIKRACASLDYFISESLETRQARWFWHRLTEQHRDIWGESQSNPKVARIHDAQADLYTKPVTAEGVSNFISELN